MRSVTSIHTTSLKVGYSFLKYFLHVQIILNNTFSKGIITIQFNKGQKAHLSVGMFLIEGRKTKYETGMSAGMTIFQITC